MTDNGRTLDLLSPDERTALENTRSIATDHEGRLIFFSRPFQELVGWDCVERLDKRAPHPWWTSKHVPRKREILHFVSSQAAGELGLRSFGGELLRSSAGGINVTIHLRTVADPTGRPVHIVRYSPDEELQDVASRREGMLAKLAAALREAHSYLEHLDVGAGAGFERSAVRAMPGLEGLSKRQQEVIELMLRGKRTHEIAEALHISPNTVRNHLKAIFSKLDVHSQVQLIQKLSTFAR